MHEITIIGPDDADLRAQQPRKPIKQLIVSQDAIRAARLQPTPRQMEIVRLFVEGKDKGEIGEILGINEATIRTHLGKLYARLGVHSLLHAVIALQKRGLL